MRVPLDEPEGPTTVRLDELEGPTRVRLDELEVAAVAARLPAPGETARVILGRSGPRGRGDEVDLPAFGSDPRLDRDLPGHLRKRIDRFSAVGYLAVRELLAGLPDDQRPEPGRIGVFLTNTRAGWSYGEPELGLLVDSGPRAMHAYQATAWFPAAAQGEITIALGLRGCAKTTAGRLGGFGEALWVARDALERGAVDLAVIGAAESLVNPFVLRDWAADAALPVSGPTEGCVVFALRRPGPGPAVRLRDLRHTGRTGDAGRDWVPTLAAAGRLRAAVDRAAVDLAAADRAGSTGGRTADIAVDLGGGYLVTVSSTVAPRRSG